MQDSLFDMGRPVVATGWPDRPRVLMSYAYCRDLPPEGWDYIGGPDVVDLIFDSGAFTVESAGGVVDHDAYLEFLLTHAGRARFALSLDVIGDPRATLENYYHGVDYLQGKVQLVPTWHVGTPMRDLEYLCTLTDYVAFGGAVPYARTPAMLWRILRHAHEIAAAAGVKVHGLGMTGRRILYQLPWSSTDSSSWNSFGRFGGFPLTARDGRIMTVPTGQGVPLNAEQRDLVAHYGFDPDVMHEPGYGTAGYSATIEEARAIRCGARIASARAFMYVETVKRHTTPDFRLYLAIQPDYLSEANNEPRMSKTAHRLGTPFPPTEGPA